MKNPQGKIITVAIVLTMVCGIGISHQIMAADKTIAEISETKKGSEVDSSYLIGPMDVLEIQVWKEPDFSRQVLVRPDGKITFPLIDDIQASGMTPLGLKDLLTELLKGYIDNPEVTVIVVESHSKNFYILGRVNQPGTYPLIPNMTVLQSLSVAGGFAEWAHKNKIRIIRRTGGKEEVLPFDYDKVIAGKKPEQNILLKPNDTIIVP